MKITFELNDAELTEIVKAEIKTEVHKFFDSNKEHFIKTSVEQNTKALKADGFFTRQISSALNKAIYDKVNREFSEIIESRVEKEVNRVINAATANNSLEKIINARVKEKLNTLVGKL